jgi:hypothetical protein
MVNICLKMKINAILPTTEKKIWSTYFDAHYHGHNFLNL